MVRTKKLFFAILMAILLCGCSSKKNTESIVKAKRKLFELCKENGIEVE